MILLNYGNNRVTPHGYYKLHYYGGVFNGNYQHKQGTYNDIPYDNIIFTCVRDSDAMKGEVGSVGLLLKVKTSLLDSIPEIGATVSPCYDRFGHVVGFL